MESSKILCLALQGAGMNLLQEIRGSCEQDPTLKKQPIEELKIKPSSHPKYTWWREELRRNGKLVRGNNIQIKNTILQWLHSSSVGGHSFIQKCDVCQQCKEDYSPSPRLLQPLLIPDAPWSNITPLSYVKSVIMMVVDRFRKYSHFMVLSYSPTLSRIDGSSSIHA